MAVENKSEHLENAEKAEYWLRMAAKQGNPPAQLNLSYLIASIEWLEKAAENNYPPAQNQLGELYYDGNYGIAKDFNKAVEWFRKAADKGYAEAQFNLGVCFARGMGVRQNDEEALDWYEKSAKQGYGPAQFNLGTLFQFGIGVGVDKNEAISWYFKAATNEEVEAQNNLATLYKDLGDQAKDKSEVDAQNNPINLLGRRIKGDKIEVDLEEANRWYEMANRWFLRAAQQGNAVAQRNIGFIFQKGENNITKNDEEAFFWYSLALNDTAFLDARTDDIKNLAAKTNDAREKN